MLRVGKQDEYQGTSLRNACLLASEFSDHNYGFCIVFNGASRASRTALAWHIPFASPISSSDFCERFRTAHSSRETSDNEDDDDRIDDDEQTWITWFCSLKGSEFFVEVDEAWMEDDFNLHGLSSVVPNYEYALDLILDRDSDVQFSEEQAEMIQASAEMLYGLIHARYILTARGLEQMLDKYNNQDFGTCPRVFCEGQMLLPVGLSDLPRQSTVKLYCARCQDLYHPRFSKHAKIDGAYFGTTFPHLFQQIYPELIPPRPRFNYVPRVFGFKIHKSSREVLQARAPNKEEFD